MRLWCIRGTGQRSQPGKDCGGCGKDGYYAADKYQALEQALTEVLATAYTNDGTAYALSEKQQAAIDACTAQLLSAYTDCMYSNRFKVTFIADGQTVSTDSYDANAAVTLTAPNATNGTWTVNGVTVAGGRQLHL